MPYEYPYAVCDEDHGYYIVPEDESVCFVEDVVVGTSLPLQYYHFTGTYIDC